MLCYITHDMYMVYNTCYVMLYNTYVMLYHMICYVI